MGRGWGVGGGGGSMVSRVMVRWWRGGERSRGREIKESDRGRV